MITADYMGVGGVQIRQKSDDVICEWLLTWFRDKLNKGPYIRRTDFS